MKSPPQVILCRSAEERERVALLFPRMEAVYANGETDWPALRGRKVVCMGDELAHFANGYAAECKVIHAQIPSDLLPDAALQWAKANARPYNEIPASIPASNPAPQVAASPTPPGDKAADNEEAAGHHSPAPPPPAEAGPDNTPSAPAQEGKESPQSAAEPPPWHDLPADDGAPVGPLPRYGEAYDGPDDWPAPMDFWGGESQPLPIATSDMASAWLWDYTQDQAALRGVDPVQPTLQCLLAISGALHNSISLRPKRGEPDYIERPVLWGATVGAPSTKKDAGQAIAIAPLIALDTEMRRDTAKRMQEHSDLDAQYQDALAAWRKNKGVGERPSEPEPVASW